MHANDDDRAKKMGLNGRKFVEDNFTIEKVVDDLEQLYKKAILTKGAISHEA